jgi:hypothetical protein
LIGGHLFSSALLPLGRGNASWLNNNENNNTVLFNFYVGKNFDSDENFKWRAMTFIDFKI